MTNNLPKKILRYYQQNAAAYIEETKSFDMSDVLSEFIHLLPPKGHLLDLGCGSGRDSRFFLERGYLVTAIDPSAEIARLASAFLGQPVRQQAAQDIDETAVYDGVWACASLLLRPTESKIIFLQQLGRGLRTNDGKDKLVVIDFIGNHHSFFRKPEALLKFGPGNRERRRFIREVKSGALQLPPGCFVNYEPQSINFMAELITTRVDVQLDIYRSLKEAKGRRPTITEFHQAGGKVAEIRKNFGSWFAFAEKEKDLAAEEYRCLREFTPFLFEIEKAAMNKCFKMVLLEAFLELDGFSQPLDLESLSRQSYRMLIRRKKMAADLPDDFQNPHKRDEDAWQKYWLRNPVNAWIGGNKKQGSSFFALESSTFSFRKKIPATDRDTLTMMVQELIDLRFLQYEERKRPAKQSNKAAEIIDFPTEKGAEIPYFTDLQIACGPRLPAVILPQVTTMIKMSSIALSP